MYGRGKYPVSHDVINWKHPKVMIRNKGMARTIITTFMGYHTDVILATKYHQYYN